VNQRDGHVGEHGHLEQHHEGTARGLEEGHALAEEEPRQHAETETQEDLAGK
jgi:hypothetical protein